MRKIISGLAVLGLLTGNLAQAVTLPPQASAVAQNVIYLGQAFDPASGQLVEGYAFIKYKEKDKAARPSGGSKGSRVCYGYLAKGAKWKSVEPWLVNGANLRGLDSGFILENLTSDISKWEDAGDGVMGNSLGVDIIGPGASTTATLTADTLAPDGVNEVMFTTIDDPGAIAVTIVWGVFGGPVANRQLMEWDQVYDDRDFDWSASGEASKMDFENIATHELGHAVGLGDLYDSACNTQTMYGYATEGETSKSSLETGDILGLDLLY